ncbi:serine--tRNA ligase [Candidatus Parcubacteria bacterium]|nr:serine--tRNA ligase [Candidatus Parcubacteria bacterium]
MLDIKFIREQKELVQMAAKKKRINFDVETLIAIDDKRRALQTKVEEKRAEQNQASQEIVRATGPEKSQILEKMKFVKEDLSKSEEELKEVMKEWQALMLQVPNVPDISVPEGESDADNMEIRQWGEIPKFDFEPKSHSDLMLDLDMVDFERGAKVAGFRGYFLKNAGVELEFALWNFVNDFFRKKGGFTTMMVPSLVRKESLLGTGMIPQSEEDLYKTQDGEYLAGTAEVATMGYYMNETLDKKDLPKKFFSFSPCFRREAGSHGKDVKGLIRVHEFYKFEQVLLCEASHEESVRLHEEITLNSEEMMQALGIPYRVVVNCGADLGLGQVKKYDIEAWVPSEKTYRETHSSSYFHDFQTRRLGIRYKDADGKLKYAHSLNNTALSGRPLIAIIENFQQADGSIKIPDALVPYMGGKTRLTK